MHERCLPGQGDQGQHHDKLEHVLHQSERQFLLHDDENARFELSLEETDLVRYQQRLNEIHFQNSPVSEVQGQFISLDLASLLSPVVQDQFCKEVYHCPEDTLAGQAQS